MSELQWRHNSTMKEICSCPGIYFKAVLVWQTSVVCVLFKLKNTHCWNPAIILFVSFCCGKPVFSFLRKGGWIMAVFSLLLSSLSCRGVNTSTWNTSDALQVSGILVNTHIPHRLPCTHSYVNIDRQYIWLSHAHLTPSVSTLPHLLLLDSLSILISL